MFWCKGNTPCPSFTIGFKEIQVQFLETLYLSCIDRNHAGFIRGFMNGNGNDINVF